MSRRKLRKRAHKLIVKDQKSHQETFDLLRESCRFELDHLANDISSIPSRQKIESTKTIRNVFAVSLIIIALLRLAGIYYLIEETGMPISFALIGILISLFVPVMGILSAVFQYVSNYRVVAVLLTIGTVRGFLNEGVTLDIFTLIVLIPVIAAIGLAFYLPTKLSTSFKKSSQIIEVEGKKKKQTHYKFEESNSPLEDESLLDG